MSQLPLVPDESVQPGSVELRDGETVVATMNLETGESKVVKREPTPREEFLTGLFETWLAPDGKPSKEQKRDARRAARLALRELSS